LDRAVEQTFGARLCEQRVDAGPGESLKTVILLESPSIDEEIIRRKLIYNQKFKLAIAFVKVLRASRRSEFEWGAGEQKTRIFLRASSVPMVGSCADQRQKDQEDSEHHYIPYERAQEKNPCCI
jgi:hypothetical protein